MFSAPMINLYSVDLTRAVAFYSRLGFVETFRTPEVGDPVHVELKFEHFTVGIATVEAARDHHQLQPGGEGRWIEIVFWTESVDAAIDQLIGWGASLLSVPHDFLNGALRAGWVRDPDGNPIQIVQKRSVAYRVCAQE